jgi:hypothetical protein
MASERQTCACSRQKHSTSNLGHLGCEVLPRLASELCEVAYSAADSRIYTATSAFLKPIKEAACNTWSRRGRYVCSTMHETSGARSSCVWISRAHWSDPGIRHFNKSHTVNSTGPPHSRTCACCPLTRATYKLLSDQICTSGTVVSTHRYWHISSTPTATMMLSKVNAPTHSILMRSAAPASCACCGHKQA